MLVACGVCGCIDIAPTDAPQAAEGGADGGGIVWYSYEDGMKIAQEQKKPVMIYVYTGWCGGCKKLNRVVYVDLDVIELSDDFVCIKIDADRHRDLAAKYNPRGYVPTIVFLRADDTVVHGFIGYKGPDEFMKEMMVALSKV